MMGKLNRKGIKVYMIVLLCVIIFDFLIISPVVFSNFGMNKFSEAVYLFFKPLCHQKDFKSFHINDVKFAVCSRCSSIYLGVLFGVFLMPIFINKKILDKSNLLLIFALIPSFFEFLYEKFFGVEILTAKVLSSLWLGGIAGLILSSQIIDMFSDQG
ncbi:MAG: DUF2085 domain-containing protein [Candidatus Kryptonium sp.]